MAGDKPNAKLIAMGCLISLAICPVLAFVRGYTLHVLWGWFLTPGFSWPSPGVAVCIGISVMTGYLLVWVSQDKDKDESFTDALVRQIVQPLGSAGTALAFGWVVKLFM